MKIKICGMKYPQNILEVSDLLPDFMGFIFWEKSSRHFTERMPILPKSIQKVGVFVDASNETILSKIEQYGLDLIQLHGHESIDFCKKLQETKIPIIKAFSVDATFDFKILEPFESVCDYFLFDTKGKLPGGNGKSFDWELLKENISKKPLFLSGGIGIDDIEKLKKMEVPVFAIDVNSKFEVHPGLKKAALLKSFKSDLQTLNL